MATRLPNLRMHDNGSIQADYVVAHFGHAFPPKILNIPFELSSERTVIPEAVKPPVNFTRLKNESASFAKTNNFLHQWDFWLAHRANQYTLDGAFGQYQIPALSKIFSQRGCESIAFPRSS